MNTTAGRKGSSILARSDVDRSLTPALLIDLRSLEGDQLSWRQFRTSQSHLKVKRLVEAIPGRRFCVSVKKENKLTQNICDTARVALLHAEAYTFEYLNNTSKTQVELDPVIYWKRPPRWS